MAKAMSASQPLFAVALFTFPLLVLRALARNGSSPKASVVLPLRHVLDGFPPSRPDSLLERQQVLQLGDGLRVWSPVTSASPSPASAISGWLVLSVSSQPPRSEGVAAGIG